MRAASFFVCLFLVLAGAPAVAQAPAEGGTVLTTAQAKQVAVAAMNAGDVRVADAVSSAILAQDPDDPEMLLVRAVLARGVGDLETAEDAGMRAYRNSDNRQLRFQAAMLVADVLTQRESYTRAQIWLRRADQAAETNRQRSISANAYRQVRQRNPLSVELRFSARPSNNVNNGAENVVIEIGGLPFRLDESGQQLGGFEAEVGASLTYRLSESEIQRTEFLGDVFFRKVWLDSDAKAKAPGVNASDFDYGAIALGLRQVRLIFPETGVTTFTGILGQSWFGGEELSRWADVSARQVVRLAGNRSLTFGVRLRAEDRLDEDINSSRAVSVSADYRKRVESGGSYGFGITLRNVWSDSATVDEFATGLRADRTFGQIGPIIPSLRARLENRNFHEFTATVDGRDDQLMTLEATAILPDVTFYGFVPQGSLRLRRTWSNVDIYDRNEFSFALTAISRF